MKQHIIIVKTPVPALVSKTRNIKNTSLIDSHVETSIGPHYKEFLVHFGIFCAFCKNLAALGINHSDLFQI